ncbi:MAG: OmpH family outer membrane protein [Candidatus Dadabacteria bacterium]|nr:MAG: OmpH family outer membrane protein [Candidatus Dadabacteria bacterium]
MKVFIAVLLAVVFSYSPLCAYGEYRVATVDMTRILNESKAAKAKRRELDELQRKAKSKLEKKKRELKAFEDKLKKGLIKSDSEEAERMRAEGREFARMLQDTEEDLKLKFLQTNKKLTKSAVEAVRKYAKQHNIDLVLDKSSNTRGPVLFGTSDADITDEILKELNR